MILWTVLTKRTLDSQEDIGSQVFNHPHVEHQDTHTWGQEHHQDQMTDAMNQEWTTGRGTGTNGQEIIRRGIRDIRRQGNSRGPGGIQGNSPDPGVLQEITVTETETLDPETGIETIKMIGSEKQKGRGGATDLTRESDRGSRVMDIRESQSA